MRHALQGLYLSALLLVASMAANAEDTSSLNSLTQALKDKDFKNAYQLTLSLDEEWAGSPEYDTLAGIAAYASAHYQKAAFAFERVLMVKPGSYKARFYLAQTYFKMANYPSADAELNTLLKDPSNPYKNQSKQLLEASKRAQMAQQESLFQLLSVNYGHDTNVNSGTREELITIPSIGTIATFDGSKETQDNYYKIMYLAQYLYPLTQNRNLTGTMTLSKHGFVNYEEYNRLTANLAVNLNEKMDKWGYQIGAFATPLWLQQTYYRLQVGTRGKATFNINKNWSTYLRGGYWQSLNKVDDKLDSDTYNAGVGLDWRLRDLSHSLGYSYSEDEAKLAQHNDRVYHQLDYSLKYKVNKKHQLSAGFTYQKNDHDFPHPLFLVIRDEEFFLYSIGWNYTLSSSVLLQINASHSEKKSNLTLYSYERTDANLGLIFQF